MGKSGSLKPVFGFNLYGERINCIKICQNVYNTFCNVEGS